MRLVLILLSVVMSFTVKDKKTVDASGTLPYDIGISYNCTYQKGDVRAGDTATLRLSELENVRLESVQVYMRSNKDAGAGVITMTADGKQLYQRSGTYKEWFGAYDNTNYHPIGWTGEKNLTDGTLVIHVAGTANSLHIEKYEITYTQADVPAFAVTLVTDDEQETLTESESGSGIVLPAREDRNGWFFVGWSAVDLLEPSEQYPDVYAAGEQYYPKKNVTLWAVWTDVEPPTWQRQAQPESGYYILELGNLHLSGVVDSKGLIAMTDDEQLYTSDLYYLDFNSEDATCTIRNYNTVLENYVGYNSTATQLANKASSWQYRMLEDSTWLFIAKEGDNGMAWILYQKDEESKAWLSDYLLGENPTNIWSLYKYPDPGQTPRWWTHTKPMAISEVFVPGHEHVIRFGIYELIIKDGKKYLRLR